MAFSSARHVLTRVLPNLKTCNTCALRNIATTSRLNVKKITEVKEGDVTVIRGEFVESPHAGKVVASAEPGCPLCRLGIQNIRESDVLILSQFMDSSGNMLPVTVTGLCPRQHKNVSLALYRAQRVGLIKNEVHAPKERWQELNNYFGDTRTKVDFGKPKIDIREFLKKPKEKLFWKDV